MNILDFLVNDVPQMQHKVDVPFSLLGGLLKVAGKHKHAPANISENAAKVNDAKKKVNKPFNAINKAVNQTVGLGFIRDGLKRVGIEDSGVPTSLMGALKYMYDHRDDSEPTFSLDANGLLPTPWMYQGQPTFRMTVDGRE